MAETAAVLVIGNEILTGKVEDRNVAYLASELFALGVSLRRVVMCPDVAEVIAEEVRALRAAHDVVLTTGGVGPTHDDVTIAGVALAFDRRVVRDPSLELMLRAHYRERLTEGHLRMADIPEGAELLRSAEVPWPTVAIGNVIVLPGVPELVRLKFPPLRERLRASGGFVSRAVYTRCEEGEIAAVLDRVVAAHPTVSVGSYPQWQREGYRTKLTFDGRDMDAVARAAEDFVAGVGTDNVVTPGD
jgi:molybdenum cofactor synthesis domain-containing protein